MRVYAIICFSLAILFLGGCAKSPQPLFSRSVIAVIKTPSLSVSQSGFIDTLSNNKYRLQIYAAGQGALELNVGDKICEGMLCMSAAEFNKRYLSENYPPNFLRDILGRKTIDGLKNSVVSESKNGWTQKATLEGKYSVHYEKSGDLQRIRDSVNRVYIMINRAD